MTQNNALYLPNHSHKPKTQVATFIESLKSYNLERRKPPSFSMSLRLVQKQPTPILLQSLLIRARHTSSPTYPGGTLTTTSLPGILLPGNGPLAVPPAATAASPSSLTNSPNLKRGIFSKMRRVQGCSILNWRGQENAAACGRGMR